MDVLILGGGGREHALALALRRSPSVARLIVAPGGPGLETIGEPLALDILDPAAVVDAATRLGVDLVVVGPEAPLAAGVSDALTAARIACFGPSRAAAMLETSKSFAKEVMAAAGVPTAASVVVDDLATGRARLEAWGAPVVVKADGLAAGKGVVVAETVEAAAAALSDVFSGRFGAAVGARALLERKLDGPELSVFAVTDGSTCRIIGAAQDHKRAFDGDEGPNTGGMGAYSPAPIATDALLADVQSRILRPTLEEMRRRGAPYRGVLYAGLMLTDDGPYVIEFNARFGDPEAQVVLPLIEGDLGRLFAAASRAPGGGEALDDVPLQISSCAALCVVLAARGYPGPYVRGEVLGGLDAAADAADVEILYAGVARDPDEGALVSDGGRVLNVVGRGDTIRDARDAAYRAVGLIDWPGGYHRSDIGWRALR